MSEQYRLVFSGEVVEGQHPAVVRKRLAGLLKLNDERSKMLFSGKAVVVKKAVDKQTAARYQAVFAKAGARLRVLPSKKVQKPGGIPKPGDKEITAPASPGGMCVLPVGSDVLAEHERSQVSDADVDTSHLSVQGAVFSADEPSVEFGDGPNVDHITLAELGAQLGDDREIIVAEIEVEFTVADVGAILGDGSGDQPQAPVDVENLNFEVAGPGADMDTSEKKAPPPLPDTSHLQLSDG